MIKESNLTNLQKNAYNYLVNKYIFKNKTVDLSMDQDIELYSDLINTKPYIEYFNEKNMNFNNLFSLDTVVVDVDITRPWYSYFKTFADCKCRFNPCSDSLLTKMCSGELQENISNSIDSMIKDIILLSKDNSKNTTNLIEGNTECECICNSLQKTNNKEKVNKDIEINAIGAGKKGIIYKINYEDSKKEKEVILKITKSRIGSLEYNVGTNYLVVLGKNFMNQTLISFSLMKVMGNTGNIIESYDYSYCKEKKYGLNLMQIADGDINELFFNNVLSDDDIRDICIQLFSILYHTQETCDFIHNDLKDKNIFYVKTNSENEIERDYRSLEGNYNYTYPSKYSVLLADFDRSVCKIELDNTEIDLSECCTKLKKVLKEDTLPKEIYFAPRVELEPFGDDIIKMICKIKGSNDSIISEDKQYFTIPNTESSIYCFIRHGYLGILNDNERFTENMEDIKKIGMNLDLITILVSLLNIRSFYNWIMNIPGMEGLLKGSLGSASDIMDLFGKNNSSTYYFNTNPDGTSKFSSIKKILSALKQKKIPFSFRENFYNLVLKKIKNPNSYIPL